MTSPFNTAALDYFASHGIDPEIAEGAGAGFHRGELTYRYHRPDGTSYVRSCSLVNGKRMGPKGEPLAMYWPAGRSGGVALVPEGEPDALAALTALHGDDLPPVLEGLTVAAIPGTGMPKDRAVEELRDADVKVVYLAFDADDAGGKATEAMLAPLAEVGIEALKVSLPDGSDLADVLAAADDPAEVLANLIAEAEAVVEVPVEGGVGDDDTEIEPLPNDAVAGLLDLALEFLDRYVILPGDHERYAEALWAAHTWAIDGSHATPYLLTLSPEKRSGKTRNQETVELLVRSPWRVTGASEAAMFRKIEQSQPTLLLDEIDAIFSSHSDRTEPVRAVLNSGNRPGASVARVVGESHEVRDFSVFCPKMLSGIDKGSLIPDTIRDRSITITMVRRTAAEPVERFRYRDADAEALPIREGLERWAAGAVDLLLAADPDLPHELDDRAAEAWEPLLAIADMAGADWPRLAREAAVALSGQEDRDEVTTGTLLLEAIRDAFGDADRIATAALLETINGDEELPFGGWAEGKGLDGRRLAKLLKPYGVRPRPVRLDGEVAKGYLLDQFEEVWERWLPPDTAVTTVTTVTPNDGVTKDSSLASQCNPVTDVTPVTKGSGVVTATEGEEAELERIAAKMGGAA